MNTYKQSLKAIYTDWKVEQVGTKNLFILARCEELMAFSYTTIIARKYDDIVRITTETFSPTTSKHCAVLVRRFPNNERVAEIF